MKKIKIGLISFGALLSVFIIACAAIRVSEEVYLRRFEKTNTAQSLYNLCYFYCSVKNDMKIVEYYPKLLFSGEYDFNDVASVEKEKRPDTYDSMISVYMGSCARELEGGEFTEKVSDAFTRYNSFDVGLYYTLDTIDKYYSLTGDSESVLSLYTLMFENSHSIEQKFSIYNKK